MQRHVDAWRSPRHFLCILAAGMFLATSALAQHLHDGKRHTVPAIPAGGPSPYAGQETRRLKALSPEDVLALRKGQGMGLAKVAELNRYPGPRHVLDLAQGLELTDGQRTETQTVFERMQDRAQTLGESILDAEEALETAFAEGSIDPEGLQRLTVEIGRLRGELRNVHLRAHLDMKRILDPEQVAQYDRLRGYGAHQEGPSSEAGARKPD